MEGTVQVVLYKEEGESGLEDRSSRLDSSPRSTPADKLAEIITLRKEEKLTGDHIFRKLKIPQKTVSRVLVRANLSRQKDIEPLEDPPMRYEHEAPGDMVHLDIKKLRNFKEEGIRNAGIGNQYINQGTRQLVPSICTWLLMIILVIPR